jgi:RNA polymerase sigma-70 factor (ECF subfamily)
VTVDSRARDGELARAQPEPFEQLFLDHWPRVVGVLARLVGNPAEAEDLALETFWRLYRRPPTAPGPLAGWLYRVALNLGYNALRAARRRARYEDAAGREALERSAPPSPDEAAEQSDERRRVRAALAELASRDAQLLILRHSGFSYKDIAVALNVAPGSVGTLLARAEAEFERSYAALAQGRHSEEGP